MRRKRLRQNVSQVDLVLDSGAYTAWTRGVKINLDSYIDYCLEYSDCLHGVVNLDVLPGSLGCKPTQKDVERSAKRGWRNLMAMRKAGIEALPVYHWGERIYWLEKMIGEGFKWVGLSPGTKRTIGQKIVWLDKVFGYLCRSTGWLEVRVHGFGVTSIPLVARYPWHTLDSIRWILVGAYGGILVPPWIDGFGYDYSVSPEVIAVSERSGSSPQLYDKHIDGIGRREREYVLEYMRKMGMTLEQMREVTLERERFNVRYFRAAVDAKIRKPFIHAGSQGFFKAWENIVKADQYVLKDEEPTVLFFATSMAPEHARILQEEGVRERLLSYYYLNKDQRSISVRKYVRTGLMPRSKRRIR